MRQSGIRQRREDGDARRDDGPHALPLVDPVRVVTAALATATALGRASSGSLSHDGLYPFARYCAEDMGTRRLP